MLDMDVLLKPKGELFLADGANGTMLIDYLESGQCPEALNITNPKVVKSVHEAYRKVGVNLLKTNTFGANSIKLQKYGLADRRREIIHNAVELARDASAGKTYVSLTVGPTGDLMRPFGTLSFQEAYDSFKEQIMFGMEMGIDFVDIQTMSSLGELRAAFLAAKNMNIPVSTSMSFEKNGRTLMGTDATTYARTVSNWGADFVEINCVSPELGFELLQAVTREFNGPCYIRPNAGVPIFKSGKTSYTMSPSELAQWSKRYVEVGASIMGGCCGTTPEHMREIGEVIRLMKRVHIEKDSTKWMGSAVDTIITDVSTLDYEIVSLKEAFQGSHIVGQEIFSYIKSLDLGNKDYLLLDFTDIPKENVVEIVEYAQASTRKPIVFQTSCAQTLVNCLQAYAGIAGIIPNNLDKQVLDNVLHKYGGQVIVV